MVLVMLLGGCVRPVTAPAQQLNPELAWYGHNRERLDTLMADLGVTSASYNPDDKPVATFDWDNSIIKNDIGNAMLYWLIRHDKVLQPPDADWSAVPFLTAEAAATLRAACGTETPPGSPLLTSTNAACADELVSINENKALTTGQPAFAGDYNHRTYEPGIAWQSHLLAGHTPDEVRGFAREAIATNLAAPAGATQLVGTTKVDGYIRIYAQIQDLISTLQANGFDVWVVSASPQEVVETFAARVGVPGDHVIGVRLLPDAEGRLTFDVAGCGPVADGENALLTYKLGKRCWINKVIFGDGTVNAIAPRLDAKRQVLAVGDSDTDSVFVPDASELRLVINRNAPELMCRAYADFGAPRSHWLINPMFIAPKPQQDASYPCATAACRDEGGAHVPCRSQNGDIISDQVDRVYAAGAAAN